LDLGTLREARRHAIEPAMLIAIDGPAASGKGTLAKRLAAHYGLPHLDTGLLYRAVAKTLLDRNVALEDRQSAAAAACRLDLARFDEAALKTQAVGAAASRISALSEVRDALLALQRDFAGQGSGAVLDGRDIGTVICPEADVKLFVTASPETRARRRALELAARNEPSDEAMILADIVARDERDRSRTVAPLRAAPDAIILDTTDLGVEAVFAAAVAIVERERA
jgi:cytidylate kinase